MWNLLSNVAGKVVGKAAGSFGSAFGQNLARNSGGILAFLADRFLGLSKAEREANAFTAQQNQIAMDFEERMANQQMQFQADQSATQWQRGVSDMKAAGLNPALAYNQGGASAMQGASASGSAGSSVTPGTSLSDLIQLATLGPSIDLMKAQARDINASAGLKETDQETRGALNESVIKERLANVVHLKASKDLMDYQRVALGPLQKALMSAQESLAKSQAADIDAKRVYTDWQNNFYHQFGYWPRENTQAFIWQVINGMMGSGYDVPPPGYTSVPFNVKKD